MPEVTTKMLLQRTSWPLGHVLLAANDSFPLPSSPSALDLLQVADHRCKAKTCLPPAAVIHSLVQRPNPFQLSTSKLDPPNGQLLIVQQQLGVAV